MDYFKLMQEITGAWCKRRGIETKLPSTPQAERAIADAEAELYGYGGHEAANVDEEFRRLIETDQRKK